MRQHIRFVLLGSLLLAASLLVAFTPTASSAFAATPSMVRTSPTALHQLLQTSSLLLVSKKGQSEIDCLVSIIPPLVVSKEIDAGGGVACSAPVSSLSVSAFLFKNGTLVKKSMGSNSGQSTITQKVTDSSCTSRASWQAKATGVVTFPSGFIPPSAPFDVASPNASLIC
ncbi:MAG TPA: hypothetical protein VFB60_01690 [Ktedonobacteraceae bacterium]|nr:hypothetical protein [Ktedonobacteraceae bacterium]